MKKTSFLFLFLGFSFSIFAQRTTNVEFDKMLSSLLDFSVPYITCTELKSLDNVILLDAREKQEYEISHLPDARYVGYLGFKKKRVADIAKDDLIVVYCSVGYRSEKIGEQLKKMGYKNVYNLYGSIFEWVNQGNPVVNAEGETQEVHPYNRKWGKWLQKGIHKY